MSKTIMAAALFYSCALLGSVEASEDNDDYQPLYRQDLDALDLAVTSAQWDRLCRIYTRDFLLSLKNQHEALDQETIQILKDCKIYAGDNSDHNVLPQWVSASSEACAAMTPLDDGLGDLVSQLEGANNADEETRLKVEALTGGYAVEPGSGDGGCSGEEGRYVTGDSAADYYLYLHRAAQEHHWLNPNYWEDEADSGASDQEPGVCALADLDQLLPDHLLSDDGS